MHTLILPGWQNSGPGHWQSIWEAKFDYQRVIQHDWMRPLRGDWITRLEEHLLSKQELNAQELQRLEPQNALKTAQNPAQLYLTKAAAATVTVTVPEATTPAAYTSADTLLVAHSLGCHLVAAWAALSQNTHRIRGVLLVAPPDAQRKDFPLDMKSWRQPVLQKLPFPSICVISSDDPFCDLAAGKNMAAAWGSRCEELGARGHINADSGLGDWPQGQAWLAQLQRMGG